MHYVKQFDINGVATKQVACIELQGQPNAATEGYVGVLGIDITSPLHDVYKCVAVNGAVYTWELLSSGMSIMSANISGEGVESVQFPYENLKTPAMYVVKVGDLILDKDGYLYQIDSLNNTYCIAKYCGTQVVAFGKSAYDLAIKNGFEGSEEEWLLSLKGETGDKGDTGSPGKDGSPGADGIDGKDGLTPYIGENNHWWIGETDTGVSVGNANIAYGTYVGTGNMTYKHIICDFTPRIVFVNWEVDVTAGSEKIYELAWLRGSIRPLIRGLDGGKAYSSKVNAYAVSEDSVEFSWNSGAPVNINLNYSNQTYRYVAIG